jgi:hypothetical protein
MNTTTAGPLLSDQERTLFHQEAARKGWQLIAPRVTYSEHTIAEMFGGDIALAPEWTIKTEARRGSSEISIEVKQSDPDSARLLFRRMIEGLPEER